MRSRHAPAPPSRVAVAVMTAGALALGGLGLSALTTASAASRPADGVVAAAPTPIPTIVVAPPATAPAKSIKPKQKKAAKKPKRITLAQLRATAARLDAALERRTLELERSQALVDQNKAAARSAQKAAVTARAEADAARVELGIYAAAAYRGQQMPTDLTVLMSPAGSASETLRNLQSLEQAGSTKVDIATYAADAAERATALEAQAATLMAEAARTAYVVETKRLEVLATARENQKQIRAEVRRIAKVQARKAAADCLAKAEQAKKYPNGLIPLVLLCSIDVGAFQLRGDAAVAFKKLDAAYRKDFDQPMCVNSAYRNRALQAKLFKNDPVMVAAPGRSHHGLGLALDLCGGIENFGTKQYRWMKKNAAEFGWYHPSWAEPDGVTPEPWHWEYGEPR